MPPRVDAIVMLDSPGHPLDVAVRLAAQHRAPFLVVSQGTPASRDPCPRQVPGVTLICFNPTPPTTQGEAEFVGRLAKKYHWQSIAVVAITPQDSRARLRVERCFAGQVYVVTAPIRLSTWPIRSPTSGQPSSRPCSSSAAAEAAGFGVRPSTLGTSMPGGAATSGPCG